MVIGEGKTALEHCVEVDVRSGEETARSARGKSAEGSVVADLISDSQLLDFVPGLAVTAWVCCEAVR